MKQEAREETEKSRQPWMQSAISSITSALIGRLYLGCSTNIKDPMSAIYEIRAAFDRDTITIYQAYGSAIADAAIKAQKFVEPFSMGRMTWIKPSFLWLMHRSNWGSKSGQERTLAVTISRKGWEFALSKAVLTVFDRSVFRSQAEWDDSFRQAEVHVQWDPERSLRGAALPHYSIQVGVSRHLIRVFVDEWIVRIADLTPRVLKMHTLLRAGKVEEVKRHLPPERLYPLPTPVARRLLIQP